MRISLRRLIGKGKAYYAATVKGISAYAAFLLLLYRLGTPDWLAATTVVWWLFNLAVSDRVLATAMDVREVNSGELYELARKVFNRAGLKNCRLCITETPLYNAMAIGMNVGRSMVILTTAALKLPGHVLEGIIAHEAVHVKKRDVLWSQILSMLYLAALGLLLVLFQAELRVLALQAKWLAVVAVMALLWIYPIYQSLFSQFMEVRADHMGSQLLEGGAKQVAEALRQLVI